MSGFSGSSFEKMKTQCGGDRPSSDAIIPNKKSKMQKLKQNKKKIVDIKKSNIKNQKASINEKIVDENMKNASDTFNKFDNLVKKARETSDKNLNDSRNNFELMSRLNEHGIEGYMLNGRG